MRNEVIAPLLDLRDVTVQRGDSVVFDRLSLTIAGGRNVAILGPNGCGKSTLVKLVTRDVYPRPSGGVCRVFGRERWNVWELRSALGIVTADLQAAIDPKLTSLEVVLSGFSGHTGLNWVEPLEPAAVAQSRDALRQVDAIAFENRRFETLSAGEARRVMIARALAHRPHTLLLDEPTTNLDIVSAADLIEAMNRLAHEGTRIVLVTHHFEEITSAIDDVLVLARGQVVAIGRRQDVMRSEVLSLAFDRELRIEGNGPYRASVIWRPRHDSNVRPTA